MDGYTFTYDPNYPNSNDLKWNWKGFKYLVNNNTKINCNHLIYLCLIFIIIKKNDIKNINFYVFENNL